MDPPAAGPEIEFEHRISHRLDVLGNRQASQLQGLGEVGYLLYGSGHVHGITWQGESLVDLERDALHREVRRQLASTTAEPLIRQLGWDSAGRLTSMQWAALRKARACLTCWTACRGQPRPQRRPRPARKAPTGRARALASRHYHYDSLGQMVGIQSPAGMSRFAYDAAGRLTGADTPQAGQQRWRFDPAGNRLPIAEPAGNPGAGDVITGALNETDRQRTQQRAGREATPVSREQMARSDYNALQGKPEQGGHLEDWAATAKWHGNRVGYYENSEDASSEGARIHYRYDSRGNRTESVQGMAGKARRKMELAYDKGNQLVQVVVHEKDDGEEEEGTQLTQRYRYDAFGRRLAKYSNAGNTGHASNLGHMGHKDAGEESGTTDYFGWDGDRLVHTERLNHGNARDINGQSQPEIVHTVYEPGSFTPLVQLRRAARAAPGMADDLIAHLPAGMARDALRAMLTDINATSALLNERIVGLGMAADAQSFINAQRQEFEETARSERQENAKSVEVRHYLCDHLGTPNALFSSEGQVEWAATLDAWGT
ncbi:RHS domain-containing protein [Diaphorobacter aerolatus]|uniref:RHS domain-containing protein n=1 Tax=Diaphorobacter aerolatus TaxID=1288495 RepID=A0A7H0GGF4_9BURK|nr:RHS domain-containing protein [Diaphorobacter aerolatus]QNP47370.1 RHS domain-containing protein [Diaphorobacter aerolatus]